MSAYGKDNGLQRFMRSMTDAGKDKYGTMVGPGSQSKKRAFRVELEAQKLTNGRARQESVTANTNTESKVGTFRSFWQIAEKEGGLMDRDTGIRVANNICDACKARGTPMCM